MRSSARSPDARERRNCTPGRPDLWPPPARSGETAPPEGRVRNRLRKPRRRVLVMPKRRPFGVDAGGSGALAQTQAGVLIASQEAPEFGVVVARQAPKPATEIAP